VTSRRPTRAGVRLSASSALHPSAAFPPGRKAKTEMSLQVLAYNMKRMINIFGVNPLMQAIAA
jgi:hypothetical protein